MTGTRAIALLSQMYLAQFSQEEKDAISFAINTISENEERKARRLTFEEVITGGECWLESISGDYGYADCYMCTGKNAVEVWRCMEQEPDYLSILLYGKTWRCWSFRPEDDRRKEEKWDE